MEAIKSWILQHKRSYFNRLLHPIETLPKFFRALTNYELCVYNLILFFTYIKYLVI
ncbi:hypothetical protein U0070_015127 [Myodes glareolus]|uniref:Maturase K n=1 Tax=Myodes glareolus TaxID=447135 RepID=A0AAW0HSL1_MYOGA